ncbi:MAG: flagellar filament capping protein FliD [Lachnospiraceae bacterium]|nr:flagellar filament capping protein FliD [Lachnospiraceae bacterium]
MAIRMTGLVSGLDTDSLVQELVSAYSTQKDDLVKAQTKLSWKQDSWKEMNSKIYGFYSGSLSNMRLTSNFSNMKKTTLSDSTKATVTADSTVLNGTQTLKINRLATAGYLTGTKLESSGDAYKASTKLSELGLSDTTINFKVGSEQKSIEVKGDMTISEFTKALNEQGVTANFDVNQQRFFVNSKSTGSDSDFNFTVNTEDELKALNKLGLATAKDAIRVTALQQAEADVEDGTISEDKKDAKAEEYYNALLNSDTYADLKDRYAVKQDATNAQIELNGAIFEGSSNTFNINGLTITAKGVSESTMSLVTETDVDAIYDTIKDFIKGYNDLIKAMDEAYNAEQAKGYEPLTDEEKESMSDDEIEKWEKKIKDSLLRRDSTLESISFAMKTQMSQSYEVNGKTYSLASFGINTLGYFVAADNEKGVYHIDGDSEDSSTKANADKLKTAIANDPDAVAGFFQQLAKGVYSELDKKMKSTTLSSAYKVYNDKQMQSEYDDYTDKIKKWEEKVSDMEDYYFDKFSAMETALSKLNSQQSQLSGLLGS